MIKKLVKFFSRIHLPFSRKKVSEKLIEEFLKTLKDGDCVLSHVSGELTNFGLDHWSHGAIFYDGAFYEATTEGVKRTNPIYFMSKKDDLLHLRPRFKIQNELSLSFLNSKINSSYDFEFEDRDNEFYCFELVAFSYLYSTFDNIKIDKKRTLLGKQFLASSFLNNPHFEIINKAN